jgi:hypothetical protein
MKSAVLVFTAIILFSMNCNCQYNHERYSVKDKNQLTQEQLEKRLKLDRQLLGLDPLIMVIGTAFIFLGIHFINKANSEELSIEGAFKYPRERVLGAVFLFSGSAVDICGLLLIPLGLTEINKIKKVLENREIKLGLISCRQNNKYTYSDISLVPGFSIVIHF